MFKETIKKSVNTLAPKIGDIAFEVNSGKIKGAIAAKVPLKIPTQIYSEPNKDWARAVDSIESPFVAEYDEEEYKNNSALSLMGLYEMRAMLKGFGLSTTSQVNYDGQPFLGKNFLVAGTGTGREVINLASLGGNVVGLDATKGYLDLTSKKLDEIASVINPYSDIKLLQSPAEDYPYESGQFDGITSLFGVINHIQDWENQIEKYSFALKPDGKLVIEKYGSNDALVFRLRKNGQMDYSPSILQRRDPKGKGILLGDSTEVLPANFPSDKKFRSQMENSGLKIQTKIGFLRIASLFPKDPSPENIARFLDLVSRTDKEAYDFLYQFKTGEELLLGSFIYDLESQRRERSPVPIEDFAYVLYVGRKMRQEEFLKGFNR